MRIHLPLLAIAASLLIPSCLENQAKTAETAATIAALEAEKTKLMATLAEQKTELDSTKTALAEATARAEQAEARAKAAEAKAGDTSKIAEMQKLMTELRSTMDKREAEHRQEVKDLNKQIQAMALEVPASGGGARSRATNEKTDRSQPALDRHIAPR